MYDSWRELTMTYMYECDKEGKRKPYEETIGEYHYTYIALILSSSHHLLHTLF